jgi:tetratricopeptide (TPR) repeat protein
MSPRSLLGLLLAAGLAWPGTAGALLTPAAERNMDAGIRSLYDLDYQASRDSFRRIITEEPGNPFGYLAEAGAIWWQAAAEYGLFKDTPTLQGLFELDIASALRTSKDLMRSKDPEQQADAYFVSGMTLGTKGQWDLLRGHYLKAYFDGKKAIKHLNKCLKIDHDYNDAYLGLGVYDYQAGHLGGVLRLSFLLGVHGNVKRGLERIQLAAQKGRYGSRQAAQFLSSIYIIDAHDFARALPIIQKLRQDFPESPYFQFLEVYLRYRLGDWDGSYRQASALFDQLKKDPPALKRKLLSLACGLTGYKCLNPGLMKATLPWFEQAIKTSAKPKPDSWETFLRLCRGQTADVAGSRSLAVSDYQWALAQPDVFGLQARAQDCLKNPCGRTRTLEFLREFSSRESLPPPGLVAPTVNPETEDETGEDNSDEP